MSPVAFSFLLSSFLLFVHSLEEKPSKSPCLPFKCGNFSNISFPFAEFHNPPCGLILVECNVNERAKIRSEDGSEYSIKSISNSGDSFTVQNTLFWQLKRGYCDLISKFAVPTFPGLVSKISAPYFMPIYICQHRLNNPNLKFISSCKDSNLYFSPTLLLGPKAQQDERTHANTLPDCSAVYYPLSQKPKDLERENTNLSSSMDPSFRLEWGINKDCNDCQRSGDHCGLDMHRNFSCYCKDGRGKDCSSGKPKVWLKIIIGISAVIGTIILAGSFFAVITYKSQLINIILVWKKPKSGRDFEKILQNYGNQMPKRYSYSDVKKMTKFFKIKLGEGGYGSVFKGQLIDGRLVAVKILSDSKGKGEDFINEVATIGRTAHVNIVRLVGFCLEGLRGALVYEFMPNGSLEKFNFSKDKEQNPLGREILFKIALGIARGLEYLHRGCNMRILHFDIKPHNILLDQDFCPKISDFGLAKLCSGKNSIVSMTAARGTVGYIAPELIFRSLGGVSHKSDVYSYGMLLLEMVGVRKNTEAPIENNSEIYFPDWIYNRIDNSRNLQLSDYIEGIEGEVARKLIIVGLWCIQTKPIDRPSMSKVVEMLEGNLEDLHIPPKPILSSLMEVEYAAPTNIETSDSLSY